MPGGSQLPSTDRLFPHMGPAWGGSPDPGSHPAVPCAGVRAMTTCLAEIHAVTQLNNLERETPPLCLSLPGCKMGLLSSNCF